MAKAGTWKFRNAANGATTTGKCEDGTPSKVKALFDAAATALSIGTNGNLIGIDPSGREFRYNSVGMGKKYDR